MSRKLLVVASPFYIFTILTALARQRQARHSKVHRKVNENQVTADLQMLYSEAGNRNILRQANAIF